MNAMRRPFVMGFLSAIACAAVLGGLVGGVVIWSGVVDVGATAGGIADKVLGYASTRSIRHHATRANNHLAKDTAALKRGFDHYRRMCVACHGGPGAEPEEFAAGLHPPAPDLASAEIQQFTDGMLYETVARGIGSTGMPAFGGTHQPDDIWSIVAFVRHLPSLTPEEKKALGRRGDEHEAKAEPPGKEAQTPNARTHAVAINAFKFDPPELDVAEGDVIEWTNKDFVAHTATADDKSFDTGKIDGGGSKKIVVRKKGAFGYFCRYHAGMRGKVTAR